MKKVIVDSVETVDLTNINSSKIYAIVRKGVVYKAHSLRDNRCAFVSMEESVSVWVSDDSLSELIGIEIGAGVFEFESLSEFCKWITN